MHRYTFEHFYFFDRISKTILNKAFHELIELVETNSLMYKGGFTRLSNAGDGYLQPANDGANIQHQLVRSA